MSATRKSSKKHGKSRRNQNDDINCLPIKANANSNSKDISKSEANINRNAAFIEENNNNNRKNKTSTTGSNDEIIEEFNFTEADLLDALSDSEDNARSTCEREDFGEGGAAQSSSGDIDPSAHTDAGVIADNDDHKRKTRTDVAGGGNEGVGAFNSINDTGTLNSAVDSTSNANEKHKVTPTNLDLSTISTSTNDANATLNTEASYDSFCPITPRRIVDVEPESNPLMRCASAKSNNRVANISATIAEDQQQSAEVTSAAGDDYYDDNDEADNQDDELLVQFLGEANRIAEARLAARRQARAEAREIRMRELERQQKEQEQNADRVFDMHNASGIDPLSRSRHVVGIGTSPLNSVLNSARGNSMSSRRSSEDSLEEEGRSLRDIRHELKDVEDRFRKAMIANAQLDNERGSQTYQIQLLKDKLEEMEETYAQLQREFKEKSRDCNALKRNLDKLSEELKLVQGQLNERDTLIAEQGLVIVAIENEEGTDAKRALVTVENAQLLGSVQGSLDVRLKKFSEEKQQLSAEVQKLQEQLENYKSQGKGRANSMNGPTGSDEDYEAQREANKIISEYKYKLQKAEQEIASLQASLARSETQVIRYKSTAEAAEKAEGELKIERRKLQRENREAMERLEELETSNNHLLKRLDKLKNAKSALLKDL